MHNGFFYYICAVNIKISSNMKNLNFTYLLRPFLVSLFLVSCSKEAENISPLSEQLSEIKSQTVKIPYAKEQELKAFSTNKNVVDYAISRKKLLCWI